LPMQELQQDWNNSIRTLLANRATRPPVFEYDRQFHGELHMAMSDASELYVPTDSTPRSKARRSVAIITVAEKKRKNSKKRKSGPDEGLMSVSVEPSSVVPDGQAPKSDALKVQISSGSGSNEDPKTPVKKEGPDISTNATGATSVKAEGPGGAVGANAIVIGANTVVSQTSAAAAEVSRSGPIEASTQMTADSAAEPAGSRETNSQQATANNAAGSAGWSLLEGCLSPRYQGQESIVTSSGASTQAPLSPEPLQSKAMSTSCGTGRPQANAGDKGPKQMI